MSEGRNTGRNPGSDQDTTALPSQAPTSAWGATTTTAAKADPSRPVTPGRSEESAKPPSVKRSGKNARQPRRARLTLSHLNVYSVFKFSCVLAIALFFVWLIVVGVLYGVLDVSGVFKKVNDTVNKINGDNSKPVVNGGLVFGGALVIGAVYMVLFIALTTIGSMVYNLCADLVGGLEVTLSERE